MSEAEKCQNQKKKKRRGGGCGGDFKEAKWVVLVPYNKVKKLAIRFGEVLIKKKKKKNPNSNPSSGKRLLCVHCCFCFKQSSTVESPVESVTSDPNDSDFTFEMLRSLIETNDFYSSDCNPHLDQTDDS